MKFFLLLFISQLVFVQIFSQNFPITDSAYINDLKSHIQKNVGQEYKKFNHRSLKGIQYSSKMLEGKITLINFWFEACTPCIAEFDALNELYKKYKDNKKFQFISFTTDTPKQAKLVVKRYNLKFPIICISRNRCIELNYDSGFPTNIIIDSAGIISSIKIGGSVEKQVADANIKEIELEIERYLLN